MMRRSHRGRNEKNENQIIGLNNLDRERDEKRKKIDDADDDKQNLTDFTLPGKKITSFLNALFSSINEYGYLKP